jgi:hypothetical protein
LVAVGAAEPPGRIHFSCFGDEGDLMVYDQVRAEAGWLDRFPDGGIAHLTWFEAGDCNNFDAWESEAAFAAFGEQRLGPAMAKLAVDAPVEPTFHAAHEVSSRTP